MKKLDIIKPYLITCVIFEIVAVMILFLATRDKWVGFIGINVALIPLIIKMLTECFSRCPLCGKRHLIKQVRCSGSRYTLYDAYCPVKDQWIDIERDRQKHKTTYLKMWHDLKKFGECREIIPIWKQLEKEKFDWVFRNVQYLELEKAHWTAEDLAKRSRCSVRYAKKVIKALNI